MLEKYYDSERTLWRLRNNSIFGPHMDAFASYLDGKKLSRETVRGYIRAAGHLGRYALWEGVSEVSQFTAEFVCRFVNEHLPNCACERLNSGQYKSAICGAWHTLDFLSLNGFIAPQENIITKDYAPRQDYGGWLPNKNSTAEKQRHILAGLPNITGSLLSRYDGYLTRLFGLSQKTRDIHRAKILMFMKWLYEAHGNNYDISGLSAKDVVGFQEICNTGGYSDDYKRTVTNCLRGFLRFLVWERILTDDLTYAVYKVIEWKHADVPRYIPYENALLLLSAPDRDTVTGKRDYLMLFLMLKLGLRANEVVQMQTQDLDLGAGQIFVRKTKTNTERVLPLTNEAAEAFADYLTHRPTECEHDKKSVFLRLTPPFCRLANSSALGTMVKQYIRRTGIKTPTFGTHQLRHSLATHLVNNGVSFKETADILGHKSIQTTGIYAKVQTERLKAVAMPFPASEEVYGL